MIKIGTKHIIKDSILGEIVVTITIISGEMVGYENKILKHTGMCHISIFEKMMV